MILAAKLNLKSAQCDITAAFLHAKLPEDEHIYVHQARGFRVNPLNNSNLSPSDFVYKLRRSQYGLRQSPRYFFEYLSERLEQHGGLVPSAFDPCLFLSKSLVVIAYVDDLLIYA